MEENFDFRLFLTKILTKNNRRLDLTQAHVVIKKIFTKKIQLQTRQGYIQGSLLKKSTGFLVGLLTVYWGELY
jgi:hypothetical protein